MKKMIVTSLSLMVFSSLALAGPLQRGIVPADAQWLIHMDCEKLLNTEVWKQIGPKVVKENRKWIGLLKVFTGIDLTKDIHGVTLYGVDCKDENGVLVIHGKFDKKKLLAWIENNEDYKETRYRERTLYHWTDQEECGGEKHNVGSFASKDLLILSHNVEAVKTAIDLLENKGSSLAKQDDAALRGLLKGAEDALFTMVAKDSPQLNGEGMDVLSANSESIALIIAEQDDDIRLSMNLMAETKEAAGKIKTVFDGIKAFLELQCAGEKELVSLLDSVAIKLDGKLLHLSFQCSSTKLSEIINRKMEDEVK